MNFIEAKYLMLPIRDENPHPPGFRPMVTYALIIINVIVFFIEVIYTGQLIDFTNENGELYATWAYIFSVAADMNPDAPIIIIDCKFEDKEKVRLTTDRETVTSFINKELSPTEFLQKIEVEPLTKGPKI